MNKYIKQVTLLGTLFVLTACQNELIDTKPIVVGDEIQFGASGYFEAGDKETRTVYGDVNAGKIEVRWVSGTDRMDIACPQSATAGNVTNVEYKVSEVVQDQNGEAADASSVATLQRMGTAGLQWSSAQTHYFFASYPSKNQIAEKLTGVLSATEIAELGITHTNVNAKLKGYLPFNQSPAILPTQTTNREDDKVGWVIAPDMTYAYMVAKKQYNGASNAVDLTFESQVTALEFEVVASDIPDNITKNISILGLQLSSTEGQNLTGMFEYDYSTSAFTTVTGSGHDKVTMTFGTTGLNVSPRKGFVSATFFILPSAEFNANAKDLQLTVIYKVDNNPQVKTATIAKKITSKKKYFFKNVKLPKIDETQVGGSSWADALDEKILVNQLSIPMAGNTFANTEYGAPLELSQQVKKYTDLWDMGVRGFELVNRSALINNNTADSYTLSAEKFVCAESVLTETPNFAEVFDKLVEKLMSTKQEPLFLLCTYMPARIGTGKYDGHNPQRYVYNLLNYLNEYVGKNSRGLTKDHFVKLNASTTIGDICGKIVLIIRPSDDDRMENREALTSSIKLNTSGGVDWSSNVTLIHDWGVAYDVWDRRYENVGRQHTYDTEYTKVNRPNVEDYLWGISSSDSKWTPLRDDNNNFDAYWKNGNRSEISQLEKRLAFNFKHTTSTANCNAYVQEWARVVPSAMSKILYTQCSSDLSYYPDGYLFVNWPESYTEKQNAIKTLFENSVKRDSKLSDLYINVLSGYYISTGYPKGMLPFQRKFEFKTKKIATVTREIQPDGQGQGGDYVGLAYDLNRWTYELLSAPLGSVNGLSKEGPWGLVVIDHIGNETKSNNDMSEELVNLIMLNNFKFPLAKGE